MGWGPRLRRFVVQDLYRLQRVWHLGRRTDGRAAMERPQPVWYPLTDSACRRCRFPMELDDVAVCGPNGRAVCLRCYTSLTGTTRGLPRQLAHDIRAALEPSAAQEPSCGQWHAAWKEEPWR